MILYVIHAKIENFSQIFVKAQLERIILWKAQGRPMYIRLRDRNVPSKILPCVAISFCTQMGNRLKMRIMKVAYRKKQYWFVFERLLVNKLQSLATSKVVIQPQWLVFPSFVRPSQCASGARLSDVSLSTPVSPHLSLAGAVLPRCAGHPDTA